MRRFVMEMLNIYFICENLSFYKFIIIFAKKCTQEDACQRASDAIVKKNYRIYKNSIIINI